MNQTIADILSVLPRVLAFAQALVASGIVKTSSGVVITSLITDLENIVSGAAQPGVNLIATVEQFIKDLQADGILQGEAITQIANGLGKFQSVVADVQANQVAVIETAELFGVPGMYAFIPNASEQGKSLGLS